MKDLKVTKITKAPGCMYGLHVYCEEGKIFSIIDGYPCIPNYSENTPQNELDSPRGFCSTLDDICFRHNVNENNCSDFSEYVIPGTRRLTQEAKMNVARALFEYAQADKNHFAVVFEDYKPGDEKSISHDTTESLPVSSASSGSFERESVSYKQVEQQSRKKASLVKGRWVAEQLGGIANLH